MIKSLKQRLLYINNLHKIKSLVMLLKEFKDLDRDSDEFFEAYDVLVKYAVERFGIYS